MSDGVFDVAERFQHLVEGGFDTIERLQQSAGRRITLGRATADKLFQRLASKVSNLLTGDGAHGQPPVGRTLRRGQRLVADSVGFERPSS